MKFVLRCSRHDMMEIVGHHLLRRFRRSVASPATDTRGDTVRLVRVEVINKNARRRTHVAGGVRTAASCAFHAISYIIIITNV